ncbi:tetratricopeptide repeat protein [Chryseobacterium sp. P1-3]|uniref:tetratricopeptide repeat protein n=1 Tax=Chryseobacterium sp. (strain P1-3) TaxID=1517683 RepID=UPI001EE6562C|nr:tetratricopeptide repeat protein [Chryseobacterium sp. P1-3]
MHWEKKKKLLKSSSVNSTKKIIPPGWFDYYQLGVTYFEIKDYSNAMKAFQKQSEIHPLAENSYYISKVYKILNNSQESEKNRKQAIELYKQGKYMKDDYTHHFNKVFFSEINSN